MISSAVARSSARIPFPEAFNVRGPNRGDPIGKQFLYPGEAIKFAAHPDVPALWRVVLAVAVYCYARDGELRVLTCGDVDLEHNEIRITKAWDRRKNEIGSPKGGKAREIMIEPTLAPLLEALEADRPDDALLFPKFPSERDMARGLRRWLTRAEVKRAELNNKTPTTRPIRFHDMR